MPANFISQRTPEPLWRAIERWRQGVIPAAWHNWLGDQSSLSARLITASNNRFSVKIVDQRVGIPRLSEARKLNLASRQWAMIREVILYGGTQPWVFARSIIPLATLTGRLKTLRHLDNRPLGVILFNDPTMTRGPVEVAQIKAEQLPLQNLKTTLLWGRRSVFRLDNKPLLVSETFLPDFNPEL